MLLFPGKKIEMEKSRYTLRELTVVIGKTIVDSFPGRYWLIAEINEIRENINGHCYLELVEKDPELDTIVARTKATIWAYTWRMLGPYFETSTSQSLAKGMKILVEVNIEFHEIYGLSLNIKDIDPAYTIGDLQRKRAETIKKLEKEGIINMNKALPFPILPARIAVISSPMAAGYEDFTHQITNNKQKFRFNLTLFPALMQGNNAGKSITDALDAIFEQESLFDLVVILRGGGSASDLNTFDSYEIAAHIAQFPLPVITGIGHERDNTIAGMVANINLKTPTAVAEYLIGKYQELDKNISNLSGRLSARVTSILEQNKYLITTTLRYLPQVVENKLRDKGRHLKSAGSILARSATNFMQQKIYILNSGHSRFGLTAKNYLNRLKKNQEDIRNNFLPDKTRVFIRRNTDKLILFTTTIDLVDPENILKKGYALVLKNGEIVKNTKQINDGDTLETKFQDGRITSKVINVINT